MRRSRGGATLLEMVIVVGLLTVIGLIGLLGTRGMSRKGKGSDALAQVIADELRHTKAAAIAQAVPTALVFPSADGESPHSQSCYRISGDNLPRIETVMGYSGDFPQSCIFVGLVGAVGETLVPPANFAKPGSFQASGWYQSQDYQVIFSPSGQVVTNDLPLVDGKYTLLVASGVRYSRTGPTVLPSAPVVPAPSYFALSEAMTPYTITITPEGEVEVVAGVLKSSVPDSPSAQGWLSAPAPPPLVAATAVTSPDILGIAILPTPNPDWVPTDVDVVIRDKEHLSFTVRATDPGGGPLYCQMQAVDETGSEVKGFAAAGPSRMTWNEAQRHWVADCSWTPPARKPVGSVFTINCSVFNQQGGTDSLPADAIPRIEKTSGGKFVLGKDVVNSEDTLTIINDDGSNERLLPPPLTVNYNQFGPLHKVSGDGQTVFFSEGTDEYGNGSRLGMMSGRGLTKQVLGFDTMRASLWDMTTDGVTMIGVFSYNNVLESKKVDGGSPTPIADFQAGLQIDRVWVSPDSEKLAMLLRDFSDDTWRVRVQRLDLTTNSLGATLAEFDPQYGQALVFSPDSERIAFTRQENGVGAVFTLELDGSSAPVLLTPFPDLVQTTIDNLAWSPDGARLAVLAPERIDIFPSGGGAAKSIELKGGPYSNLTWSRR